MTVVTELPEPPKSCKVLDRALDKVDVVCEAGDNGGIDQHFILEVLDNHGEEMMGDEGTGQPLYRMLAQSPRFTLQSLQHEKRYKLMIYSKNLVGRSMPPVVLDDVHLPTAMERLARNGGHYSLAFRIATDIKPEGTMGVNSQFSQQPWSSHFAILGFCRM